MRWEASHFINNIDTSYKSQYIELREQEADTTELELQFPLTCPHTSNSISVQGVTSN